MVKRDLSSAKVIEIKATESWSNKIYIVNGGIYSGFQLQYVNEERLVRT